MSEVCLTNTYTASGIKNYPFSSCAVTAPNPACTHARTQTHTRASICRLYSHVCIQTTQSQVRRAWRAQGVKLDGKFWSSEAHSVPKPVPWLESQESHTGNGFTQQDHNACAKKQKVTKSLLHATLHPRTPSLFILPNSHVIRLSVQNQKGTKEK